VSGDDESVVAEIWLSVGAKDWNKHIFN
jgi:hypothetical protein